MTQKNVNAKPHGKKGKEMIGERTGKIGFRRNGAQGEPNVVGLNRNGYEKETRQARDAGRCISS